MDGKEECPVAGSGTEVPREDALVASNPLKTRATGSHTFMQGDQEPVARADLRDQPIHKTPEKHQAVVDIVQRIIVGKNGVRH